MDIESAVKNNPYTGPSAGPAKTMTAYEVIDAFVTLDQDKDGQVTNTEFVDGLKANWQIAQKFGLEQNLVLEDVSREKYDLVFGQVDYDNSKTIDVSLCKMSLVSVVRNRPHTDLGNLEVLRTWRYSTSRIGRSSF